ncbi:MAG: glycine--tRNA ligase subunit beta [Deltaproteobacteria bacterium]|nr:glycine--tRNA ligase subunit beta [Deltaproteobacteria bacterium]
MSEYLLEIGSGELPYDEVRKIPAALKNILQNFLENEIMLNEKPDIEVFSTPRRTFVLIKGLPLKSPDREVEIIGPPVGISYHGGVPAAPLLQFMKKNEISDYKKIYPLNQKKGVYTAYKKRIKGMPVRDLLTANIPQFIKKIPFRKTMFWLDKEIRYPRPILWILSIFDGKNAPFNFGDIKSSNRTYIAETLSYKMKSVKISGSEDYFDAVSSTGIILKNGDRKKYIEAGIKSLSKKVNADMPEYDDDFIDEITGLTETPYPIICGFDEKFLSVPGELLSVVMRKHQRFFPLSKNGSLLSYFAAVADVNPAPSIKESLENNIKSGYSKVLTARLADAEFFFKEDNKKKPPHFVEETKNILFYQGLGSYFEKTERIGELGIFIAGKLNFPSGILSDFKTASGLLKFDLATHVVYEFPEMQGIMGRIYANASKESPEVSLAIEEHYYPVSKAKKKILPSNDLSALCSLSDKLDTVLSFVMLKKLPTGESDPFYLRRAMIGVIEIILDKRYKINLSDVCDFYFNEFFKERRLNADELKTAFMNFAYVRFKNHLLSGGYKPDEITAVLTAEITGDFYASLLKIDFLSKFKKHEEVFELSQVYKRINNITYKFSEIAGFDENKLIMPEEVRLIAVFKSVQKNTVPLLKAGDYAAAVNEMNKLVHPVNGFFDGVMVLTEEEEVKNSRLGLLNSILNFLKNFCDFSGLDL